MRDYQTTLLKLEILSIIYLILPMYLKFLTIVQHRNFNFHFQPIHPTHLLTRFPRTTKNCWPRPVGWRASRKRWPSSPNTFPVCSRVAREPAPKWPSCLLAPKRGRVNWAGCTALAPFFDRPFVSFSWVDGTARKIRRRVSQRVIILQSTYIYVLRDFSLSIHAYLLPSIYAIHV